MLTLNMLTPKTTTRTTAPVIAVRPLTMEAWGQATRTDLLTRIVRFITFKR